MLSFSTRESAASDWLLLVANPLSLKFRLSLLEKQGKMKKNFYLRFITSSLGSVISSMA